jgi:hypothetical protein
MKMKKPKVELHPGWKLTRMGQLLRVTNSDGTEWETFDLPYGWETLQYGRAVPVIVEGRQAYRYRLVPVLVGRVGDALVASELIVFVV